MCGIVGRNVQTYGVFHEHSYHACISSAANHLPRARRSARHGGSKIRTLTRNVSSRSSVDRHADGQSALDNSWKLDLRRSFHAILKSESWHRATRTMWSVQLAWWIDWDAKLHVLSALYVIERNEKYTSARIAVWSKLFVDSVIWRVIIVVNGDCLMLYVYTVFLKKKTSTHIIGYKSRNSCLILIIFDTKIPP